MKRYPPVVLMTLLACLLTAAWAPVAHADFGVTEPNFEAATCNGLEPNSCTYASGDFFTQAAGHPEWGITKFELNHSGSEVDGAPLKRIRVDIPPGLAGNPEAIEKCLPSDFEKELCSPTTKAGTTELDAVAEPLSLARVPLNGLKGDVYNLGETTGLTFEGHQIGPAPLLFGINVAPAGQLITPVHLLLVGHVEWSTDYHEYFEIDNVPTTSEVKVGPLPVEAPLKVLMSKLNFNGTAGGGNFLTLPSVCSATTTSSLEVESYAHETSRTPTHTPVGVSGCEEVPFKPTAQVTPETSQYDTGDGITTELKVPQFDKSTNTADIRDAHVTLPEGLTLNPSGAHDLQACTQAQLGKGTTNPVSCPAAAKIGTVNIETDLPPNSLSGNVYLGKANGTGAITAPPYLVFLDAESIYGVSLRLEGTATPDPETGRLEVSFRDNPQLPFSSLSLKLNGGARAPLANPLTCGGSSTAFTFTPWTGQAAFNGGSPFTTSGCPSPIPFAPAQSTHDSSTKAGAFTSFTFTLQREDSQQYLDTIQAVLPAGLVGFIPGVPRCGEPLANAGSCASSSKIGTATASAGTGTEPYEFSGPVYLTGPYNGAPYGLSIPIEAAAGPFDLGRVTTRVGISVDPYTGRVIATGTLPKIVGGVPLRLRSLSVAITRSKFLFNPSFCGALATESTLGSSGGALAKPSSPFQVTNCTSLPFKPVFTASSPTAPSRANGASLEVGFTQPGHQANIRSVVASLPKVLPSRDSTLKLACPEATFASGYRNCPSGSKVGSATVTTPVLPDRLGGPAYLVSHGGAAFPDLDLILEGDGGVKVILVGNTDITKGVTTSTFASVPDVPVSSFMLSLPTARNSLLGSYGSLCAKPLYMPTIITAQSGAQIKQKTRLSIGSCKIKLLSHRVRGHFLLVRVQTYTAGRVSVTSPGLHTTYRHLKGPAVTTIKVPLSKRGRKALAAGGQLHVRVRVGFNPRHKDEYHSAAYARVIFKH